MLKAMAMTLVAATLTVTTATAATIVEANTVSRPAKIAARNDAVNEFRQDVKGSMREVHDRLEALDAACDALMKAGREKLKQATTKEQKAPLVAVLNSVYAIRYGSGMNTVPMGTLLKQLDDSWRIIGRTACCWTGRDWAFDGGDARSVHTRDEHDSGFCPLEQAAQRMAAAKAQTDDGLRRLFGRPGASAAAVRAMTAAVVRDTAAGSGNHPRSISSALVEAAAAVK